MDTHADTCCLDNFFVPLLNTGEEMYKVHAYSDAMDPIKDIPIGTSATLWTNSATGASYIIKLHEALMFTNTLKHSLLNPNQIQQDGHSICDDPWDQYRPLGLSYCNFSLFIPSTPKER
jgi:hypothetical protein